MHEADQLDNHTRVVEVKNHILDRDEIDFKALYALLSTCHQPQTEAKKLIFCQLSACVNHKNSENWFCPLQLRDKQDFLLHQHTLHGHTNTLYMAGLLKTSQPSARSWLDVGLVSLSIHSALVVSRFHPRLHPYVCVCVWVEVLSKDAE